MASFEGPMILRDRLKNVGVSHIQKLQLFSTSLRKFGKIRGSIPPVGTTLPCEGHIKLHQDLGVSIGAT